MSDQRDKEQDILWVQQIQNGQVRVFEQLVLKYQKRIYHVMYRFCQDHHTAEDLTQEAFIKAFRAIQGFRSDSGFYTWMYRIAVNTAKNYLVSLKTKPQTVDVFSSSEEDEGTFSVLDTLSDEDTPDRLLENKQLMQALSDALEDLPADLHHIMVLRELEGLSYDEIAKLLDIPIGTVRSRIFRARAVLLKKMDPLLD
ncbi:MAG: sigma-70 family RNA polymerase sigma factor [Alcaligenaceae bacterium]|nr:sigma-70 family RNA polymerase sigma factor [Alcaligenaceae bacterium]